MSERNLRVVKSGQPATAEVGLRIDAVDVRPHDVRVEVGMMELLMDRYPKQALRKARRMRDNQIRGPG